MNTLENITTEVPATSFDRSKPVQNVIREVSENIIKAFNYEQTKHFYEGQAKQGQRSSNINFIIKDILSKEIENLQIVKEAETNSAVINSKIKKILNTQVDNIISILEMSTNKTQDNNHYLLGMLLKSIG